MKDKVSYALGLSMGHNFKAEGFEVKSAEDFTKGLLDVLEEKEKAMTMDEAREVLNAYLTKVHEERIELNKSAGAEYQLVNSHKKGVTTLPSGVQYEILVRGDGEKPKLTDSVKCHYHGTLINGVVFDSSVQRGEPATFPVNGVIQGWQEILQLMPVGSKWRVTIPYQHAYGEHGAGQMIEPYSTLIFDIEFLDIVK